MVKEEFCALTCWIEAWKPSTTELVVCPSVTPPAQDGNIEA
jgi:hypothetical protein